MKQGKSSKHRRFKALGAALASVVLGVGLLVFSQKVKPAEAEPLAATQPATTAPAGPAGPEEQPPPGDPKRAAAQNMSGLLLLFSTMFFLLAVVCVGWVIYDVRESRPSWQKQKKYPVRR